MVIALILCIPLISISTSYLVLKAYREGLKHNYELKHDVKPSEPKPIIKDVFDNKENKKQEQIFNNILDEYLNGAK